MVKIIRVVSILVCMSLLFSLLGSIAQPVLAAPGLTISTDAATPGQVLQVKGTGFGANVTVRLYWDSTDIKVARLLQSTISSSDGSVVFNLLTPPDAQPGTHLFYAYEVSRTLPPPTAQANITIKAATRKAALIVAENTAANQSYKALMDANGILTTLVTLSQITTASTFTQYDLIIVGPDTGNASQWGNSTAVTQLLKTGRPILGIGDGGYAYFGTRGLLIGYGNGAHGSGTDTTAILNNSEIFTIAYQVPVSQVTLFNSSVAAVEIYQPQFDNRTLPLAQIPGSTGYSWLMQQGRFLLWGYNGDPSVMTADGKNVFVNAAYYLIFAISRDTLFVTNTNRMRSLGTTPYTVADVVDMNNHITDLMGRPNWSSNMYAARTELSMVPPTYLNIAGNYSAWNMSSAVSTNALAGGIDAWLENLKRAAYPNLKYFIMVGSHEIIPMQARAADNYKEDDWGIPAGNLYDLYHSHENGALGYYLTDSLYSDLSYITDGWGADSVLNPEMSVGRLVETPVQISGLITTYIAANGSLSRSNLSAIGSQDYMDGATFAANAMGPATDTTLIQNGFLSSNVPPKLNGKHDIVYIGGHGNYNWMTTREWDQGFEAGADGSQGDTDDLNVIDNAAIAAAGCHNGAQFPNLTYFAYSGNTSYGEFPERLANKHVGIYAGATGYTWVSISGSSTNVADTMYSEKATALFIQHLYQDGGTTAGKAFQSAAKQYLTERGVGHLDGGDRRAVSIFTLYGIPNYRFATFVYISPAIFGFTLQKVFKFTPIPLGVQPATSSQVTAQVTLDVSQYNVNGDGVVTIPGANYTGDAHHPILPEISASWLLPGDATGISVAFDSASSKSTTITNDIPAPVVGTTLDAQGGKIYQEPGGETFTGFYPTDNNLGVVSSTSPLGASGTELSFAITPVQYNHDTHQTRIWTHLAFNMTYTTDTAQTTVDSDGDGLPDYWETANGLDPNDATGINGAAGDPDSDGLANQQEFTIQTDPLNPDTDHDGFIDGTEVRLGTDPLDPGSHPFQTYLPAVFR